jgi:hypothetical protein
MGTVVDGELRLPEGPMRKPPVEWALALVDHRWQTQIETCAHVSVTPTSR